jgi:hypothetical protein
LRWFWGLVAVVAAFVTWQAASAGFALHNLASAAKSGDGKTILRYTDLPAVRRSIARQVFEAYARQVPEGAKKSPLERALGSQVGAAVIDVVLAQLLTADNLSHFLREGTIKTGQQPGEAQPVPLPDRGLPDLADAFDRLRLVSPIEIAVRVSGTGADYSAIRLKSNALGWRLAGIDLPAETLNTLVARLRGA